MVLVIENEELLKRWIKGEIVSLNNNADPIHLSDYIVSIIKQNNNTSKTIEQTKAFCKEQLSVFLKDKTTMFVDCLIQVLEDNSYIVDFDEEEVDHIDEYNNDDNDDNNDDRRDNNDENDNNDNDDRDDRDDRDNNDDSRKRQKLDDREYERKVSENRYSSNDSHRHEHTNNRGNDRYSGGNNNDKRYGGGNSMHNNMPYNMGHMGMGPMGMMDPRAMGPMGVMGMGIGPHGYSIFNPMMNGQVNHGYGAYLDNKKPPLPAGPPPPTGPPPTIIRAYENTDDKVQNIEHFKYNNSAFPFSSHNKYNQQNKWGESKSNLPEIECCTLKCTGLPPKVTSDELKKHFKSFGRVVEIQMKEVASDKGDSEKKVYNECLVQFSSAADAKKCLNSPAAVLNNRFIKLHQSNFNIIPFEDVKPLTAQEQYEEEQERERLVREKKGPKTFNKGKTKKFARPADDDDVEREYNGVSKTKSADVLVAKQKAEVAVKNQYDDLRKLREQAELISKKKEQILETQIENYRILITKAQHGKDEDVWEAKIMDLQKQLNSLRNERDKVNSKPEIRSPTYGDGRGRGGGRTSFRGRSFRGGRGGRGRGGRTISEVVTEQDTTADQENYDLADSYVNGFDNNEEAQISES